MKRVFLYGFFGIRNAGNEAMLRAFVEPIRRGLDEPLDVVVCGRHPDPAYDARYGVRTVPNLEYPARPGPGRWLRGLNPDDSGEYLKLVREIAMADLVVIGPGQYLVETGEHGLLKGALAQAAAVTAACALTHTPCYGLALACEALTSAWGKLQIEAILRSMAGVTFRDDRSVDNLRAAGIAVPPHEVLGDLALAGEPADAAAAAPVLAAAGVPPRRGPRLAVACRNVYWIPGGGDPLRDRLAATLEGWLRHPDRDVLMIPQNVYAVDGDRDDDRAEARRIVARLPEALRARVHAIEGEPDEAATEALYGGCDVTLSARLHGSVFSCKQGTPPVVLTFMDKTRGFFRRLGAEDCMVDLQASPETLLAALETALATRDARAREIQKGVAAIRQTARGYAERAIALLNVPTTERQAWARAVCH